MGIPILRNSERSSFKKCQYQWHWGWNMGLVPAMVKQDALWFGTGIHLALAEYYTPPEGKSGFVRGRNPLESWEEFCAGHNAIMRTGDYYDNDAEYEYIQAKELGLSILDSYLKHYGDDGHWEVLMPETRFVAKIPFTIEQLDRQIQQERLFDDDGEYITKIAGTFDMPVRDHSFPKPRIMIVDHKTTNRQENIKHLQKDDQAGTYIAVGTGYLRKLGFIEKNEAIDGMIFNYLRKAKADNRPRDAEGRCLNKDGSVSKNQPSPLFWRATVMRSKANRLRQIRRIAEDAEQIALARDGSIPLTKAPGEHCNWCQFSDLCDIDENGDDVDGFIEATFKRQDPYADHRDGAVNSKESVSAKKETGVR